MKALTEKRMEFHTYKLKEERTQYRYSSMNKLSNKWAHKKVLPPQTEMREMRR
jgi:hypothetical protein